MSDKIFKEIRDDTSTDASDYQKLPMVDVVLADGTKTTLGPKTPE